MIYRFPFQLFLILEKMPVTFFTSNALTTNHYVLFIPKNWKQAFLSTIKYETAAGLTCLIESTIIDTYQFPLFTQPASFSLAAARLLRVENYISLTSRTRYTVIESATRRPLSTSSFFFKNAVWLEREFLEMYGPVLTSIYDTRNLLLEYSFTENPMLKTYPTEGFADVYYDFFRDQLCYVQHEYVEL